MYTVQSSPSFAQAAAVATPCCPAPVSALCQKTLPDCVVYLVRARVGEPLKLYVDLRAPEHLRSGLREQERRLASDVVPLNRLKLLQEAFVLHGFSESHLKLVERPSEDLRHIFSAELIEESIVGMCHIFLLNFFAFTDFTIDNSNEYEILFLCIETKKSKKNLHPQKSIQTLEMQPMQNA